MVRTFQELRAVDPGFDPSSMLTFSIGLPQVKYPSRQVAGTCTFASSIGCQRFLVSRAHRVQLFAARRIRLRQRADRGGRIARPEQSASVCRIPRRSQRLHRRLRTPLLRGRSLTRADIDRQENNIVVNKAIADGYFPGQDPIGRRVRSSTPPNSKLPTPPWWTIVGVVANTSTMTLGESTPIGLVFQPMSIAGGPDIPREALLGPDITAMSYIVRSSVPSSSLVPAVRRAVDRVDPNLAIAQVRMLQDIVDRASDQMAFTMVLLAIAAVVALLLGAIGIYGVISYVVTQRTGEIGVRLAMGAEPRSVAAMILCQGGVITLLGIAVGLIAALAGSQLIRSLLYGVSPRDPVVFSLTTLALLAIGLLACWLPARRAARLSPLEALRTD